jgi:hypothetical protein
MHPKRIAISASEATGGTIEFMVDLLWDSMPSRWPRSVEPRRVGRRANSSGVYHRRGGNRAEFE